MDEKVNIINKKSGVTVQNLTGNKHRNVSKSSFRIGYDEDTKLVGIYTFNARLHNVWMSNVTIQNNTGDTPGAPIQLTPENWDSLTEGLTESKGGGVEIDAYTKSESQDHNLNEIDASKLGGKTLDEVKAFVLPKPFATLAYLQAAHEHGELLPNTYFHTIEG